jgi:alpha-tubulin suppressor-like RCC1 family protein
LSPVLIGGVSGVTLTELEVRNNLACVSSVQLRSYCYGKGTSDGTGTGSYNRFASGSGDTATSLVATPVNPGSIPANSISSISLDSWTSCVLSTNNNVYCWGNNVNGSLGNGNNTNSNSAVPVTKQSGVLSGKTITNQSGLCAIADDEAYCWGYGSLGRLGDGGTSNSNVPKKTSRLTAPTF